MVNQKIKPDVFRICNFVIACAMSLSCLAMMFYYISIGDPNKRVFACVASAIPFLLPYLLERILNRKLGNYTMLIYLLFVFYSAFIGSVVGAFKTSAVLDKIAHTIFGYLACYIGLAISLVSVNRKEHPWFVLIFCFLTSIAFASLWEIFEFTGDSALGQTAQGFPVNGIVDITDTMLDVCVNFAGAIIFVLQYILHVVTKKNWFIDTMANDLTLKPLKENHQIETQEK